MHLFDDFDAVLFPQENKIFITSNSYLYYIYDIESKWWSKHKRSGWDTITVENYPDVSKDILIEAMGGHFPEKETDFIRMLSSSQLHIGGMRALLMEDFEMYMSEYSISSAVCCFLRESKVPFKSYENLRKLLNQAVSLNQDKILTLHQIEELSMNMLGKNIFQDEIEIIDGHDGSSYFCIMPVRVIDYDDTNEMDNVAELESIEICIDEMDVGTYLFPFLLQHFDAELEANKKRVYERWEDDDGDLHATYYTEFEWNLVYNFYSYDSIKKMLKDIKETMDALSSGAETNYIRKLREYKTFDVKLELILNFYRRFIFRMEYMIQIGKENGYDLISFMGP